MNDEFDPPATSEVPAAEAVDLTPPTDKPKKGRKSKKEAAVSADGAAPEAKAEKEEKKPSNRANLSKVYPEDAVITVLATANPKKAGSAAASIFEFYKSGQTVGDFFAATAEHTHNDKKRPGTYADITYDVGHGYIKVG